MKYYNTLLFAGVAFLLSSCDVFLGKNLSNVAPYSTYTGKIVTLNEPMVISESYGNHGYTPYAMTRPEHAVSSRIIRHLDTNSEIKIDFVRWSNTIDSAYVVAVGSTVDDDPSNSIRFRYYWGGMEYINRAPWEPVNTPNRRYTGWKGNKYRE